MPIAFTISVLDKRSSRRVLVSDMSRRFRHLQLHHLHHGLALLYQSYDRDPAAEAEVAHRQRYE
jgi:hypothetical protein